MVKYYNKSGSVSHLDFLTNEEKETFKTAFEIDQRWVVELGADRTPYISQAQSVNVFVPADVHKKRPSSITLSGLEKGLKAFIIADLNQFKEQKILIQVHQQM